MLLIEEITIRPSNDEHHHPAETCPTYGGPTSYLVDGPQPGPAVGLPEPSTGTSGAELLQQASPGPATCGSGPTDDGAPV